MLGFGSKTAQELIPNMKEMLLNGEKRQTIRLCRCNQPVGLRATLKHALVKKKVCKWHKLKIGDTLHQYWKPRTKKQWKKRSRDGFPSAYHKENQIFLDWEGDDWVNIFRVNNKVFQTRTTHTKKIFLEQVGGCEFLGLGEVTEIINVEMWKGAKAQYGHDCFCINISLYDQTYEYCTGFEGSFDKPTRIVKDLAKRDSFKNVEDMFKFFDKVYDLSEPKKFVIIRWRLV